MGSKRKHKIGYKSNNISQSKVKDRKLIDSKVGQSTNIDELKTTLNPKKTQKSQKRHKLKEERLKMLQMRPKSKQTVPISKQSSISKPSVKGNDGSVALGRTELSPKPRQSLTPSDTKEAVTEGKSISKLLPSQSQPNKTHTSANIHGSKSTHKLKKPKRKRKSLRKFKDNKLDDEGVINTDGDVGVGRKKAGTQQTPEGQQGQLTQQSSGQVSANWKAMRDIVCASDVKKPKRKAFHTDRKDGKKRLKIDQTSNNNNVSEKPIPDIWFTGVDPSLLGLSAPLADQSRKPTIESRKLPTEVKEESLGQDDDTTGKLVKEHSSKGLTHAVAMDCEMVGVSWEGKDSILARVSVVNQFGHCVYDTFVKPREKVTDYRTFVSGVRERDLKKGEEFEIVQKKIADILKGRVLVGHAVHNDLKVLFLSHPRPMIRDTQAYRPFRDLFKGSRPSLRKLADQVLGVQVQKGEHSSVQDAQATMRLYTMYKKQWEKELRDKRAAASRAGEGTEGGRNKSRRRHRLKNTLKNPPPI